jgi:hypothetical protein
MSFTLSHQPTNDRTDHTAGIITSTLRWNFSFDWAPSNPVSLKSVLILSHLDFGLFPPEFPTNFFNITVFWDVAPCSVVDNHQRFTDAHCFHHQDDETAFLKHPSVSTKLQGATSQTTIPSYSPNLAL